MQSSTVKSFESPQIAGVSEWSVVRLRELQRGVQTGLTLALQNSASLCESRAPSVGN